MDVEHPARIGREAGRGRSTHPGSSTAAPAEAASPRPRPPGDPPHESSGGLRKQFEQLLAPLDIHIDGDRPWDIRVNDVRFYERVIRDGFIGAGEGYMAGEWDCEDIPELIARVRRAALEARLSVDLRLRARLASAAGYRRLRALVDRDAPARRLAATQYDLGNDFFASFLDSRMVYSCAYWRKAQTLEEAQVAKLDLICRKLRLEPGMRLLDIGGGWGGLAIYAAQHFGVHVTNITISNEQARFAEERRRELSKDVRNRIINRLEDYRDVADGPYDRVVSVGMFEHVRHDNYRQFMEAVHRNLTDGGLFLLHTIGMDAGKRMSYDWTAKYIFPESEIPIAADVTAAYADLFAMEDWHNFGADYEKTLLEWFRRFEAHWPAQPLARAPQADRFYRMWKLYLLGSAGSFRGRTLQLWQIVLSKGGVADGYESIR